MAGFIDRVNNSYNNNNFNDFLKEISTLGIKTKLEISKNSKSIGYGENVYKQSLFDLEEYDYLNILSGDSQKSIPFFDQDYKMRLPMLRKISQEGEIENILSIISDESVVYDESNFFCQIEEVELDLKNKKAINESLDRNFKSIYNLLNFSNPNGGWWMFYKWLVDGFLAFEIIYNNEKTKIIGFKILDPTTLEPSIDEEGAQIWIQFRGDGQNERILYESQLIYISYASSFVDSRQSYVERLIKPFNMLKNMEIAISTWATINASFRLKFIIPLGGKSTNVAKQTLRKLMSRYSEEIHFSEDTGDITSNGRPYMPGMKQTWLPEKDGATPTIEPIGGDGPDLNNPEMANYYKHKLWEMSKIPFSRMDQSGGETVDNTANQITQDEARFNRFIIRLRSIFKEILIKPIWIQTIIDHPELKDDVTFKTAVNIEFFKYNLFEELKDIEVQTKKLDHIERLMDLEQREESNFDINMLIKHYKLFKNEDLEAFEKFNKEKEKKKAKESEVDDDISDDDTNNDTNDNNDAPEDSVKDDDGPDL